MSLLRFVAVVCFLAVAASAGNDCPEGSISGVDVTITYWTASPTTVTATLAWNGGSFTEELEVSGSGNVTFPTLEECIPIGCYEVTVNAIQVVGFVVEASMDWNSRLIFRESGEASTWSGTVCFDGCANTLSEDNYIPKCYGGACKAGLTSLDYECECEGGLSAYIAARGPTYYYNNDDDDDSSVDGSADGSSDSADGSSDSADGSSDSADGSSDHSEYDNPVFFNIYGQYGYLVQMKQIERWESVEYSVCYTQVPCVGASLWSNDDVETGADLDVWVNAFGSWYEVETFGDPWSQGVEFCLEDACTVMRNHCNDAHTNYCESHFVPENETYEYECHCEEDWTYEHCDHPECSAAGYARVQASFDEDVLIELYIDGESKFQTYGTEFDEYVCANGTFDADVVLTAYYGQVTGHFEISYNWDLYVSKQVTMEQGQVTFEYEDLNPCSPARICSDHGTCTVDDSGNWAQCDCDDGRTGWRCEAPVCDEGVELLKIVVYGASPMATLVGDLGNVAAEDEILYEYEGTYFCTPEDCYTLTLKADIPTNDSLSVWAYYNHTDVFGDSVVIGASQTGSAYFCLGDAGGSDSSTGGSTGGSNNDGGDDDGNNDTAGASVVGPCASVVLLFVSLLLLRV